MLDDLGDLGGYLHLKDVLYADEVERLEPVPAKRVRRMANVRRDDEVESVLQTMQLTGVAPGAGGRPTTARSSVWSSSRTSSRSSSARCPTVPALSGGRPGCEGGDTRHPRWLRRASMVVTGEEQGG